MIEPEGKFIGKYRILARVGQGGMGTVYKAYQPGLERFVAIKTLRHEYGREEEAAALFKKEARAIARLRHKNILQIYDFDVADDVMYMVTEFVEGMTLAEYLQMDDEQMPQSLLDSGQATPVLFEQLPQVKVDIPQLHHILDNRFNEGELRNLCLYLDIDYEDLPGQAQADKARELILYLERRHNFARLLTEGKRYRPDIEWNKAITLVLPVDKPPPEKGADSSVFGISKNLIEIFMTLAEAVGYAHSQNVVHHDLKPGNVIITPEGRIVLMDFGLAQILDATMKSKDDMVMGTPLYISPEQCQGQRGDKRSDIYSLGVILYEMVTGQVPFNARNYAAIIMKHIMEPPPPPRIYQPEIPPLVESVILRALRKDADGRFQSAEEMVVALNQAMATVTPGVVTESGMMRRPSEPRKPVST
ncbi:MAG: protein kinase, partial [Anaerolineae bacterium]